MLQVEVLDLNHSHLIREKCKTEENVANILSNPLPVVEKKAPVIEEPVKVEMQIETVEEKPKPVRKTFFEHGLIRVG